MGISWSGRRRNNNYFHNPPSSQFSSSFASQQPQLPPPLPPSNIPYSSPPYPPQIQNPYPAPNPPYPPHPNSSYYQYPSGYNNYGYTGPFTNRSNFSPYYPNQGNGWSVIPAPMVPQHSSPPYVDHVQAKTIRNDVNVHKDTIKVEVDEMNPEYHLVSFTFDAIVDGSITIFYFAKEEANCKFTPIYPESYTPAKVPFQKGPGQKFRQPSGTGMDLGFFELDDLSKPSPTEDIFPLVISAESGSPPLLTDEQLDQPSASSSSHAQITQAVLEKKNGVSFDAKVIRQILWVDEVRYELREIYGIQNSDEAGFDDNDPGKECVICMTEPKDTAVLPCRHMCLCSECAKALRLQSNKCPICRQLIEELVEIKVNKGDH